LNADYQNINKKIETSHFQAPLSGEAEERVASAA
jgi:hypothetical protein